MALFGHKLCDLCGTNRATIKLTRVDGEQVSEMLICPSCAAEKSPLHRRSDDMATVQSLFANLIKEKSGEEAAKPEPATATCRGCGLAFEAYRKTFLLGCPACYESFADALAVDLRKIHGDVRHLGKVPPGQAVEVRQEITVAELRQRLASAIECEDFEAAARLRDQIRLLESRGEGLSGE